jgi:hypothetical protein
MRSLRSRCALAGAFLLAAATVFVSPPRIGAQSNFDGGQQRADLGELRHALDQLLRELDHLRDRHDDARRWDDHHRHFWHGFGWADHDRRNGDAWKDRDEQKRSEGELGKGRAAQGDRNQNRIGAMPGQSAQTVSAKARLQKPGDVFDVGRAKQGDGAIAGAAEARRVRIVAPAGQNGDQQANPPGAAKQGAGPGNVQAKNGAGKNRFANAQNGNQANGAPAANQANPNAPGVAKNEHHHHHHHFGEAKDAGPNGAGKARQGQSMGNCKNGAGPQANQVRAKSGNGGTNAGSVAKNSPNGGKAQGLNNGGANANAPFRPAGNNQANNRPTANPNTSATQAYVNHLLYPNGARQAQQNQRPTANNTQKPQGNIARQSAPPHSPASSVMRPLHGFSHSPQAHAGSSVGQRGANHSAHVGKR